MAKRSKKARSGSRGEITQPQRPPTHLRSVPTSSEPTHHDRAEDQALFQGLRGALRSDHPTDLLETVSGLLTVTDPRTRHPFSGSQESGLSLDVLVDSFAGTDHAETTAALTVIRSLVADDLLKARLAPVLALRRQPLPSWLTGLQEATVTRTTELTHVLGDGDDYLLEVRLPDGHVFTTVVYVDHNLGTVVKDAFVVPAALESVLDHIETVETDPDQTYDDVDAATTRAILDRAIEAGARLYPPSESDSWPLCRPLVEWVVRLLPEGGTAPTRPVWTDKQLATLRREFFSSPYAAEVDGPDARRLLEQVTWFGTDYGPGDPTRWSPVSVEMLLVDWVPRKIVADASYLVQLPDLLRAFVRYCHDRTGIRPALTTQTVEAVDHWEPEYQELIGSGGWQGPASLLARLLAGDADGAIASIMLDAMDRAVGGCSVLRGLDDAPLPDEAFDWTAVPADVHERVREVLDLCDRCADDVLDVEHRTAMRRFLSRAAAGDPKIFRRKGSPERAAAAVCWVVTKANGTAGYEGALDMKDLLAWFGVTGSVSQRAEVFLKAVGVDPHQYGRMDLGAPDLLVGARRRSLVEQRERYLSAADWDSEEEEEWLAELEAADHQAAEVLRAACSDVLAQGPPTESLSRAVSSLRHGVDTGSWPYDYFTAACGWRPAPADEDHSLWLQALAATISPPDDPGTDPEEQSAVFALQHADWLGIVVGLVRRGPGARFSAKRVVEDIASLSDIEDESVDPEDEAAGLDMAVLVLTPLWQALGVLDDDERLTTLGRWGLPGALDLVWSTSEADDIW